MVSAVDLRRLRRQIILAVAYADQFEFPLTSEEIWQRLIYSHGDSSNIQHTKNQKALLLLALNELVDQKVLIKNHNWYMFPQRAALAKVRVQRAGWSAQKQSVVAEFLTIAAKIPWITGVFVTGSLAVANAQQGSDVDFMIVTRPQRLWLTRLLVVGISSLWGKRRADKYREIPNSWCLNIWVDEQHLAVPVGKRSIYTAHEVCQAQWVYGDPTVRAQFYTDNAWAARFLPNAFAAVRASSTTSRPPTSWLYHLVGLPLTILDRLAFMVQKLYMYPHMTRELVEYGVAYFHPRHTQQVVYTRWQHALRQSS